MSVYAQIPEGCTFDDAVDTLAANGGTGMKSSDAASLCTKEAIKAPFSKNKPIRLVDYLPDRTGGWYKGVDGLCGFSIDKAGATDFSELASVYNNATDDMNGWEYLPPRGNAYYEPFRIADFGGYFPSARPISFGFSAPNTVFVTEGEKTVMIGAPTDARGLMWTDFTDGETPLSNYYFGVVVYQSISNNKAVTSTSTLADGGVSAVFNTQNLSYGDYTIYPFISSHKMAWGASPSQGQKFYALPNIKPVAMEVLSASSELVIRGNFTRVDDRSIEWSIKVTNNNDSPKTLTTNSIKFQDVNYELVEESDRQTSITLDDSITIPAKVTEQVIASGKTKLYWAESENFYSMPLYAHVILGGGVYDKILYIMPDLSADDK